MGQGANLGPFDDEETRAFYEDVPDLLDMLPSVGREVDRLDGWVNVQVVFVCNDGVYVCMCMQALLGLTEEEAEKLRQQNSEQEQQQQEEVGRQINGYE